jgi:hypothetical protein
MGAAGKGNRRISSAETEGRGKVNYPLIAGRGRAIRVRRHGCGWHGVRLKGDFTRLWRPSKVRFEKIRDFPEGGFSLAITAGCGL